jgi:regulator of protease activity HflC (stomatin/prohibitin superfamily)
MEVLTAGLAVVVLYLFGSLRIIRQYERAVTFFLGRCWGTKPPPRTHIYDRVQRARLAVRLK